MGLKKLEFDGYFDSLPEKLKNHINDALNEAFEEYTQPGLYPYDSKERTKSIECRSRDGFIPFSHNRGGLEIRAFTDLMGMWGSGYTVAHKGAQKEIERQIDYSFQMHAEHLFEKFKTLLESKGITQDQCNYHDMQNLAETDNDLKEVSRYCENSENDFLSDDQSSIMFELRFMYHGEDNGTHSASISAAVNTEGPYHRSHISWAPNVFCEGAKEVEIEWTNQTELKRELKKALATICKQVF